MAEHAGPGGERDGEAIASKWLRIRWPDFLPLPVPGRPITLAAAETGTLETLTAVVVRARPTSEPGWLEVEVD